MYVIRAMVGLILLTGPLAHAETEGSGSIFTEESLKLRDPFKAPNLYTAIDNVPDIERFPLEQFKLMGVMSGPSKKKAMLTMPDGKTVFIEEKMKIGNRNGVVKRISESEIVVTERLINVLGQEEIVESELKLPSSDGKSAAVKDTASNGGLGSSPPGMNSNPYPHPSSYPTSGY